MFKKFTVLLYTNLPFQFNVEHNNQPYKATVAISLLIALYHVIQIGTLLMFLRLSKFLRTIALKTFLTHSKLF